MFEQTFKNIDDILFKDAGADSELDYIGQTSWVGCLEFTHSVKNLHPTFLRIDFLRCILVRPMFFSLHLETSLFFTFRGQ
jgi:hypothetical protein